jgi:hypothetical protein
MRVQPGQMVALGYGKYAHGTKSRMSHLCSEFGPGDGTPL